MTEGEDEPVEAVLGRYSPVTEEWQRGGAPEVANAGEEGTKKLEREGMRCGEIRGSHRPFIGAGGAPERGGQGE
jgi:hypothetical protein